MQLCNSGSCSTHLLTYSLTRLLPLPSRHLIKRAQPMMLATHSRQPMRPPKRHTFKARRETRPGKRGFLKPWEYFRYQAVILDLHINFRLLPRRMPRAKHTSLLPAGEEAAISLHREFRQRSTLADCISRRGINRRAITKTFLPNRTAHRAA